MSMKQNVNETEHFFSVKIYGNHFGFSSFVNTTEQSMKYRK